MESSALNLELSLLQKHVLRTLLYYDIFNYPLTGEEVFKFLGCNTIRQREVKHALDALHTQLIINEKNGFFYLGSDESRIARRIRGNAKAGNIMPLAYRISAFIGAFPFVKGVGISGSLSKHYMDEASDIDFFIITKPGRLWLTRTLLILFKKVCLLNSRKYFCINYLITTDNLEIPDRNVFTATELVTMIPVYGGDVFKSFYSANTWVHEYLPNYRFSDLGSVRKSRSRGLKWVFEKVFSHNSGTWLDKKCMALTTRVWRKKFSHMSRPEFDQALRSREDVSKHHPQNFQRSVLQKLEERINGFEKETGFSMEEVKI